MISLETIGMFSDAPNSQHYPGPLKGLYPTTANFVAFVAMPGSQGFMQEMLDAFQRHSGFPAVGGVAPSWIQGIASSDHARFAERGIPAMMITDTALFRYPHYHLPSDTPDKVDFEKLAHITLSLSRAIEQLTR